MKFDAKKWSRYPTAANVGESISWTHSDTVMLVCVGGREGVFKWKMWVMVYARRNFCQWNSLP